MQDDKKTPHELQVEVGYWIAEAINAYAKPSLQDWLAELPYVITEGITICAGRMQIVCDTKLICFNLTTGQPNSPEDYKRFNEITSL